MPYHRNVFPVDGRHGSRGAVGMYHAGRSGGRIHEGFDILAACGTKLVAAATGKVTHVGYDPVLYGNYLEIHGQGERRSYFYAHLIRPPRVHRGERVWAGEGVGAVGQTGNAISTPCHLHFELPRPRPPGQPRTRTAPLGPLQLTAARKRPASLAEIGTVCANPARRCPPKSGP